MYAYQWQWLVNTYRTSNEQQVTACWFCADVGRIQLPERDMHGVYDIISMQREETESGMRRGEM